MASFRSHISLGIASGVVGAIGLLSAALVDAPLFLMAIFVAAVLGSVLPDMDSDSGIPFHVAFGSLSLVATALVGFSVYQADEDWESALLWSVGAFGFVYGVIGHLFKRFTRHRGMAHSVPAALLAGLTTFFLATHFSFSDMAAFLLGMAMIVGYLSHLILDELYAAVNFHGRIFVPNKAFGSALKWKSHDRVTNALVFGAILFLLAGNAGRFVELAIDFGAQIRGL